MSATDRVQCHSFCEISIRINDCVVTKFLLIDRICHKAVFEFEVFHGYMSGIVAGTVHTECQVLMDER